MCSGCAGAPVHLAWSALPARLRNGPGQADANASARHLIPVRLELQREILGYLKAAGIGDNAKDRPLFRSTVRKTKQLTYLHGQNERRGTPGPLSHCFHHNDAVEATNCEDYVIPVRPLSGSCSAQHISLKSIWK